MQSLASAAPEEISGFFDAVAVGVAVFDLGDNGVLRLVCSNTIYRAMHQIDAEPAAGSLIHDFLPRYVVKHYRRQLQHCLESKELVDDEMPVEIEGVPAWYRLRMVPVFSSGDRSRIVRLLTTSIDITHQKRLEDQLDVMNSRLEAIVDSTYDAIVSIDSRQRIKTFNLAAEELFCYERDEVIGQPIEMLLPQKVRATHSEHVESFRDSPVMSRPMEARVEVSGQRSDGTEFPAEVAIAKIDVHGKTEFTAIVRDISVRLRLQEELKQRATTDPLTGLYNRRHLDEVAENEFERCQRYAHPLSLLLLDVDNFKTINDSYGHPVGDKVLTALGELLQAESRKIDLPARWGGEELCILIPETGMDETALIAERLLASVRGIHAGIPELKGRVVTASIGVAAYRDGDAGFAAIVERADAAMYRAKHSGKDQVVSADK